MAKKKKKSTRSSGYKHPKNPKLGKDSPGVYKITVSGNDAGELEAKNKLDAIDKFKREFPDILNTGRFVDAKWDRPSALRGTTVLNPAKLPDDDGTEPFL